MKNVTITEKIVVRAHATEDKNSPFVEREFAFIEDAEAHFNFAAKGIEVFKRKVIDEEIPTENRD